MSAKSRIRLLARKFGVEINRYNTSQSHAARIGVQLAYHEVDCVVDVGANDGGYGRFIRTAGFNGNIVSFEPQADAHEKLMLDSRADPAWYIAPRMALGDAEAAMEINVAETSTSSSLLRMLPSHVESAPESKYVAKVKVAVRRLDALDDLTINAAQRIYLKIDTQDFEKSVLQGASGLMKKVVGIQLEMSVIQLYEGQELYQDLLDLLGESGFEMWGIQPGFMNRTTGRMLQFDGIFFRRQH